MIWQCRDTSGMSWIYVLQKQLKHKEMTTHDWQQRLWLRLSLQHSCSFDNSLFSSPASHTFTCKVKVLWDRTTPKQNGTRWKGRGTKGGRQVTLHDISKVMAVRWSTRWLETGKDGSHLLKKHRGGPQELLTSASPLCLGRSWRIVLEAVLSHREDKEGDSGQPAQLH